MIISEEARSRKRWAKQVQGDKPRMPESLERLLRAVNSMTWQQVFGLKDAPSRSRVYRMGVYRADGPARCESAELVRWADGSWSWTSWIRIPEIGVEAKVGGHEPAKKYAMKAAEQEWRKLCEHAYSRAVKLAHALRGANVRMH